MISRWAVAFLCAAPFAALAQISPCESGQQLGNNAVITSGNAVYSSPGYVSAGSLSVNVVGTSVAGNGSVTIKAGTAICLGPGFKAAATSSGGGFTALIGSTPPAGAFAVTTASLVGANQGASYQQTLNASGGIPSYTWSQAGGSLPPGLSLNSAGVIAGTAAVSGTYVFVAQVHDAAGATATQTLSITVASVNPPSLSINGGSGNGETLATVTVPLVFALYDSAGANDIGYAQFYLADSAGNAHCYGEWGRQNALFLYDGNTGLTDGFGIDQSDSFCTVSLQSITNSPTDPTETTVVLNFTFNQGFAGTYSVMEQVDHVSGTGTPWQNVGTLTIESPPTLSSQPTVTLTDNTQSSGYYFAGDSFTLTVTGPPNQPVGVSINGFAYGTQGYTNSSGVYSINGSWSSANVGSYLENWYVESVAGPTLLFSILPANDISGPVSIPNSYTALPPALACNDITGNWIATPSSGPQSEWDLTQDGNGQVHGTAFESSGPQCGAITYSTVSGQYTFPTFSLTVSNPSPAVDACGVTAPPNDTHSIGLYGNSCSLGSGRYQNSSGGTGTVAWQSKTTPNTVTPTSTATTAHYNISYASYIPVDHIPGPRPCFYLSAPYALLYKGDAFRGTYRTTQSVVLVPGSLRGYNTYVNSGPTRNYGKGSPAKGLLSSLDSSPTSSDIYNGRYAGADEDNLQYDCLLWNDRGQALTNEMQNVTYSFSLQNNTASVIFQGLARDPLEPSFSPPISWNLTVTINESDPAAPTAQVFGTHTCYPAHNIKVNGTLVYDSQRDYQMPAYNNTSYLASCLSGALPPVPVGIPPTPVSLQ